MSRTRPPKDFSDTTLAAVSTRPYHGAGRYLLVVLLGLTMGVQNATARALAVPDATTTVLTLTLTGLAADSRLAAGPHPRVFRRVASVLTMLSGAFAGALLVLHTGPQWALTLAAAAMLVITASTATLVHGTAPADWQHPG